MLIRFTKIHIKTMRKRIMLYAVAAIVAALCAPAAADRPAGHLRHLPGEGPRPVPVKSVVIEKKMLGAVVTTTGATYAIDHQTIIVGPDGGQVSILRLLVPCDAELTVEKHNGVRTARRVQVVRTHARARWQWTGRQPE